MPNISVIIPVYNQEQHVEQCLQSVCSQSEPDLEIIVIDDGSSDLSGDICERFAAKDPRIILIHKKNEGVAAARNVGIELATGDNITFVDCDDWLEPDCLEQAATALKMNRADVVFFSYYKETRNNTIPCRMLPYDSGDVSSFREEIQLKCLSTRHGTQDPACTMTPGCAWCKLISGAWFRRTTVRFPDGVIRAEDTVFWLEALEKAESLYYVDQPLYHYRKWPGSITSGIPFLPDSVEKFDMLIPYYTSFINHNEKGAVFDEAFLVRVIWIIFWNIMYNICHSYNPLAIKERSLLLQSLIRKEPYHRAIKMVNSGYLSKGLRFVVFMLKHHMSSVLVVGMSEYYLTRERKKKQVMI